MLRPVTVKPSASEADRIGFHQRVIVEEVAKMFRVTPAMLITAPKETPFWKKVAGYAANLLRRDTRASDQAIAKYLGDVPSSVPQHIEYISTRVAKSDSEVMDRLARLTDSIYERVADVIVFIPRQKPDGKAATPSTAPRHDKKRIMETVARIAGIPFHTLDEDSQSDAAIRARDVIFLIFTTYLDIDPQVAGDGLNRNYRDVSCALKRMQSPSLERWQLLTNTCKELGIDIRTIVPD